MSTPRQYLLCVDERHAALVDQLILADLMERGTIANAWSNVWVSDEGHFGVLWAEPVSLFGSPEDDPTIVIETETIDADGVCNWQEMPPPDPEPNAP